MQSVFEKIAGCIKDHFFIFIFKAKSTLWKKNRERNEILNELLIFPWSLMNEVWQIEMIYLVNQDIQVLQW